MNKLVEVVAKEAVKDLMEIVFDSFKDDEPHTEPTRNHFAYEDHAQGMDSPYETHMEGLDHVVDLRHD